MIGCHHHAGTRAADELADDIVNDILCNATGTQALESSVRGHLLLGIESSLMAGGAS